MVDYLLKGSLPAFPALFHRDIEFGRKRDGGGRRRQMAELLRNRQNDTHRLAFPLTGNSKIGKVLEEMLLSVVEKK